MELNLKGRVVAITGGATGIGLEAGLEYAREGCKVAICGRTEEKLEKAKEIYAQEGFELFTMTADVMKEEQLVAFVKGVDKAFGRLDIFVNNAGLRIEKAIIDTTAEEWDTVMDADLRGVFIGTREAARVMREKGGGVIINISSFASVIGQAGGASYSAAKSAVNSLTYTSAAELAPYGIRVLSIVPGVIKTPLTADYSDEKKAVLLKDIALHRFGTVGDIAKPIVFLSSPAASYITGTTLEISGGKYAVQNADQCR